MREFVRTEYSEEAWDDVLEEAGLGARYYMKITTYPDEEVVDIVEAAAEIVGTSVEDTLRAYGRYLASDLLSTYDAFLEDDWGSLDVLESTETAMHKAVRLKEDEADPPELDCERLSDDEVVIEYSSDLELCNFGEGLIQGIADVYDESLRIRQHRCQLRQDPVCEIHVERA